MSTLFPKSPPGSARIDGSSPRPLRPPCRRQKWLRRAIVLVLAAGLSMPLPATGVAAAPVTATYRVFVGGVTALDVDATLEMTGARYRITVSAVTGGTIGRLFSWRTEAESDGLAGSAGLRPDRHRQSSIVNGEPRSVDLRYDAQGDVAVTITPPPEEEGRPPRGAGPAARNVRSADGGARPAGRDRRDLRLRRDGSGLRRAPALRHGVHGRRASGGGSSIRRDTPSSPGWRCNAG
ncbi:DUF3108 domain-containing protein [Azospirillum picis]|uniref:DUF3108 domain-containing protein n=1 Tax=Azospirillum picis TaxID=488438 RepID=UPI001FEA6DC7|nr:DUF3108 domain-containing protein [Azospirillum picis]